MQVKPQLIFIPLTDEHTDDHCFSLLLHSLLNLAVSLYSPSLSHETHYLTDVWGWPY